MSRKIRTVHLTPDIAWHQIKRCLLQLRVTLPVEYGRDHGNSTQRHHGTCGDEDHSW